MRIRAVVLLFFALSAVAAPGEEVPASELAARAAAAPLEEQPSLYIKAAERQLKVADKLYDDGNPDAAAPLVKDVAEYSGKATEASVRSGKHLKGTEIGIRKMAERLRDIQHRLNYDDQAPVKAAVDKLEELRTQLLNRMFAKDKK